MAGGVAVSNFLLIWTRRIGNDCKMCISLCFGMVWYRKSVNMHNESLAISVRMVYNKIALIWHSMFINKKILKEEFNHEQVQKDLVPSDGRLYALQPDGCCSLCCDDHREARQRHHRGYLMVRPQSTVAASRQAPSRRQGLTYLGSQVLVAYLTALLLLTAAVSSLARLRLSI